MALSILVHSTNIAITCYIRWRKIRVFLCGDYLFLGKMYGISGASGASQEPNKHVHMHCTCSFEYSWPYFLTGRHCCLYCSITHERTQIALRERGRAPLRALNTLSADYLQYQTVGKGNLKNAKNHNNVIGKAFFYIPLLQVYIVICYTIEIRIYTVLSHCLG